MELPLHQNHRLVLLTERLRHDDGVFDLALQVRVAMHIYDRALDGGRHLHALLARVEDLALHSLREMKSRHLRSVLGIYI